ncbi:hypothetical protein [Aureliella helgolandensis]|uniref:PilZ domain-containing protein n=1 Tax=Aureliella helgolandensis TaxID=2527968 RepID=A0A518G8I2_9BACT|nr:hypothetical protein [Aureliella helgolandensis]QDV24891.1 hypothetical protein Q31a_32130 [Aureliella helgolandensis]
MLAPTSDGVTDGSLPVPPLLVQLPKELEKFFQESGYLSTTAEEERRNARLRVRQVGTMTMELTKRSEVLYSSDDFSAISSVLIKDLSRSGVGFLYHREVFPGESVQIQLKGRRLKAKTVRCRRLGPKCYEVGCLVSVVGRDTTA